MLSDENIVFLDVFLSLAGREARTKIDDFMFVGEDEPGEGMLGNDPAFSEAARLRSQQFQSLLKFECETDIELSPTEAETLALARELGRNLMAAGFGIAIMGHMAIFSLEEDPTTENDAFQIVNLETQETIVVDTPALVGFRTMGNIDTVARSLFRDIDWMLLYNAARVAAVQRGNQRRRRHKIGRNRKYG